jgi:hypothetical protein
MCDLDLDDLCGQGEVDTSDELIPRASDPSTSTSTSPLDRLRVAD